MTRFRVSFMLLGVLVAAQVVVGGTSIAQAKTLVGAHCTKLGAQIGDGPGRTVVCRQKGKRAEWQLVLLGTPSGKNGTSEPTRSPTPSFSPTPTTPICNALPQFTENFIDPKYVLGVTPIGGQTGSGGVLAVRSYIFPSREYAGLELPIYAPVAMTLTQSSFYKLAGASTTYSPEYSLYFDVGCGISVKFFHVKGVTGNVAKVAQTVPSESSAGQPVTPTKVAAGEQIGWYKLGENSVAFDFWVDNAAHTNTFINPIHFAGSSALHSVCPFDYYAPDKRAIWLAKLGDQGGNPVPGTECGVVNEGLAGTAEGMWFLSPETIADHLTYDGYYQSQIMFHTDAAGTIRIGGLNTSQTLRQMIINTNASTWRKATDITVGTSHCWSDDKQSVKVKVIDSLTMSVVVGLGDCSSLPDISMGKTYYR